MRDNRRNENENEMGRVAENRLRFPIPEGHIFIL
jgi:hypothetical protein